jgi:hypothetical protein
MLERVMEVRETNLQASIAKSTNKRANNAHTMPYKVSIFVE